jgi:hypothetical protein
VSADHFKAFGLTDQSPALRLAFSIWPRCFLRERRLTRSAWRFEIVGSGVRAAFAFFDGIGAMGVAACPSRHGWFSIGFGSRFLVISIAFLDHDETATSCL